MREILFRGKPNNAIMENNFIYGLIVKQVDLDGKDALCIQTWERDAEGVSSRVLEVIPSTIGEFTGLTDKNGTKIFEGDIVKNEYEENKYQNLKIAYKEKLYAWVIISNCGRLGMLHNLIGNIEVIGNIYDNLELLKEV